MPVVSPISSAPCIILVQPQLAENIGSVARAMLNFGITELRLVDPFQSPVSPEARRTAAGAHCVLENAHLYKTLEDALKDLQTVYATTARPRDMTKIVLSPGEACEDLVNLENQGIKTGILFGREKSGLTNDHLSYVGKVIEIPVNPQFGSLNLAQAVVVLAYEWRKTRENHPSSTLRISQDVAPARQEDLLHFFTRLESALDHTGFLSVPGKRPIMVRNIRNIFNRCHLTDQEVRTLQGILSSLLAYP